MPAAKETVGQIEYYSRAMEAPGSLKQQPVSRTRPVKEAGSMRSTSPLSCPGKSQPGKHPEPTSGPGPPGSWPRKSLEDFDFDHQPGLKRDTIAHLATGTFLTEASNIVLLGPPAPAKHTSPPAWACGPPSSVTGSCSPPPSSGSPGSKQPTRTAGCPRN